MIIYGKAELILLIHILGLLGIQEVNILYLY